MKEGTIVKSLKGHDEGRVYAVVATAGEDFVLLCDGKYRKLDNPKQKRVRHVEVLCETEFPSDLTDKNSEKFVRTVNLEVICRKTITSKRKAP